MDRADYNVAKIITQNQTLILREIEDLDTGEFTQANLLRIYTLLSSPTDYNNYVGSGYETPPDVAFTGGGGTGAAGAAVLTDNLVAGVTVMAGGIGYTTPPVVTFTGGGGTGAAATAVLTGDAVTSVVMVNTSLYAQLYAKIAELEADFAAL